MSIKSRLIYFSLLLFSGTLLFGCSSNTKEKSDFYEAMDHRTRTRFRQYMILGKGLYQQHCANCHGQEGEGLERLIPPLAKSDYLMAEIDRAVCQITNGMKGEIVVNGVTYNQEMPANKELRALEIAEITTYIANSWGNQRGLISSKNVQEFLRNCTESPSY